MIRNNSRTILVSITILKLDSILMLISRMDNSRINLNCKTVSLINLTEWFDCELFILNKIITLKIQFILK